MKYVIVLSSSLLLFLSVHAQKMTFPELQKLKLMDKQKQDSYLLSKHYEKANVKSDGPNEAVIYKNLAEQGGKIVIRNVTLINAEQLNMTMLEYTTYDGVESATIVAWLLAHGYRKSVSMVNGKAMTFFRSERAGARFYQDKGKLRDGSDFNSSSFVLEY